MTIKTLKLAELDESVRAFLDTLEEAGVVRIDDEDGEPQYGIARYLRASDDDRRVALTRLAEIQKNVRRRMEAAGKIEDELDAILQEDE